MTKGIDKEATFDAFGFPKGVKPVDIEEGGRGLPSLDERYENNFRLTNRVSLKAQATTARAQTAYRRKNKNKLPRFDLTVAEKPIYIPEEAHPYGKANRPSTPVGDVVSNYYG